MKIIKCFNINKHTVCETDKPFKAINVGKTKLKVREKTFDNISVLAGGNLDKLYYTFTIENFTGDLTGQEIEFVE